MTPVDRSALRALVAEVVTQTPVFDIHTHLYDPAFGELLLWGIDDLLTYHYLIAESFRWFDMPAERFWAMGKSQQAEAIWNALFIEHSPISEACRGVPHYAARARFRCETPGPQRSAAPLRPLERERVSSTRPYAWPTCGKSA
jgi:hypothetical protein